MKRFSKKLTVSSLVEKLEGNLVLVEELTLDNVAELQTANKQSLCFYENSKFLKDLADLETGLLIAPLDFDVNLLPQTNLFLTAKPYLTFNTIVSRWLALEGESRAGLIHSSASIPQNASLGNNVIIKENVVLGSNTSIGDSSVIEANTVIGDNVSIGRETHLYPNCTIYPNTTIGDRVIIHASGAIGVDGFGYIYSDGVHHKVNHIGVVIIEDDVEIGANTCVDRATIGKTIIGKGTKIDNLVQIGHNCQIERGAILCSQVGLAGHTKVGNFVYLAGQVGAAGHLKINDGAMIGAQSGISGDVPAGAKYFGTPAIEAGLQKRIVASLKRLPEILRFFNKFNKDRGQTD